MYIKVSKVLHRALLQKQHSHQVRGSQTYRRVGLSLMPHRHYTRVRAYAYNDDWWPAILSTPGHPRPSLLLLIGQQQQFFVLLYHCRWRQSSQVKHVETFNTVVTAVEMTYATCLFNMRSDDTLSRASCQEFSCSAMVVICWSCSRPTKTEMCQNQYQDQHFENITSLPEVIPLTTLRACCTSQTQLQTKSCRLLEPYATDRDASSLLVVLKTTPGGQDI